MLVLFAYYAENRYFCRDKKVLKVFKYKKMTETVGTLAGAVWTALNENGTLVAKDLKKAAKIKCDKDLFLALGWLLREDKVTVTEEDKSITITVN